MRQSLNGIILFIIAMRLMSITLESGWCSSLTSPCTNASRVQFPLRAVCANGIPNPCSLSQVFSGFSGFLLPSNLGRVWLNQKHPLTKGEWGAAVLKVDLSAGYDSGWMSSLSQLNHLVRNKDGSVLILEVCHGHLH